MNNDTILFANMANCIIVFYVLCACCWWYIWGINAKLFTPLSFACFVAGALWIWYGYKNYDFYYIVKDTMDYRHMWNNLGGVIVLLTFSACMCVSSKLILDMIMRMRIEIAFLKQRVLDLALRNEELEKELKEYHAT